jgi:enamine deaminase RidA (YjgF/YER057c/UK114 family)
MEVSPLSEGGSGRREFINDPAGPPRIESLSHVVRAGDFLFVSGFIGTLPGKPATGSGASWVPGELAEGGIEGETRQTLLNIESALRAAGSSLKDVVKVTAFLRDVDLDFDAYNRTYIGFFPDNKPARITAQAKVYGRSRVEIDAIAYQPASEVRGG